MPFNSHISCDQVKQYPIAAVTTDSDDSPAVHLGHTLKILQKLLLISILCWTPRVQIFKSHWGKLTCLFTFLVISGHLQTSPCGTLTQLRKQRRTPWGKDPEPKADLNVCFES